MRARILTIGDELLIGQIVDTNSAWLGQELTRLGISVDRVVTLADDLDSIVAEARDALSSADLTLVTGGLGPTHDDVTKTAVCSLFGVSLVPDPSTRDRIRAWFRKRGADMPERLESQALVPEGFEALPNAAGTAPGLWHDADPDRGWGRIVVMPGVPHEMKSIMQAAVLPRLSTGTDLPVIVQRTLLSTGIGESKLQELIGDLDDLPFERPGLAYLPSIHGVRLRLTARAGDRRHAEDAVDRFEEYLKERAGQYIYGEGEQSLEQVVGEMLRSRSLTIATAESCTGGLIAHRITEIAGASDYMAGSVVAYVNEAKTALLGVPEEELEVHGAVSRAVAEAMALGVRDRFGTDVGLATTGIMGPGGGTEQKPVGTVWICAVVGDAIHPVRLRLGHTRSRNKAQAATAALNLVRLSLLRAD